MSFDGVWFDPASDGCGFAFLESEFGSQAFFFGHTADGRQLWLTGYGNPSAGISLTYTAGTGFPTVSRSHAEAVGKLQLGDVLGDGVIEIIIEFDTPLAYPPGVDFSPIPEGDRVVHTFRCQRIKPSGPM